MRRTRLTILALFWLAWVVVLPFAHHHLVRTPRDTASIQCGGSTCFTQCAACQWGATSVAQFAAQGLYPVFGEAPPSPLLATLAISREPAGSVFLRAPPLA